MKKFWALLVARNKEFYRDRGTMIWTFVFPFIVILGFSFAFSGNSQDQYKVALYKSEGFERLQYVQYVPVDDLDAAIEKVKRHQFDLVVAPPAEPSGPPRYWVNSTSPKGYLAERLLPRGYAKQTVEGRETRYVDWLIPGILAMNMMFSALYGVGYTIVRYRKNGVLKRFKATPINALQFLSAQVVSRVMLMVAVSSIVYIGCNALVHFQMRGSYLDLLLFMMLGGLSLISLSSLVAARISSEEFAEGLLNVMTWPMMLFSGVWFSLEGTNPVLQKLAQALPMTHIVDGARAIMIDGASWGALWPHVGFLAGLAVVCLGLGSALFRWN
jgi:ABC-type multidrug transport system permease subunit